MRAWPGVIETYRKYLPVTDRTPVVTLHEGNTPLVPAPRLAEATDPSLSIYLKCEGFNPTGSFKDRGMTMAISKAVEGGARAVICASTGNTSASAAAFAARAGVRAFVMVPKGAIALGKLSQAAIHGAKVLTVDGNFDQALSIVRQIAETHPVTLVNSVNPFRLEGQKTAAFEVVEDLGGAPDALCIPVGNAGNVTAWWRGFGEAGVAPRLFGFQAAGAAPLVEGHPIAKPETIASASIGPSSSAISSAAVFWPSSRNGFTEFTRAIGWRSTSDRTSASASSKLPRSATTRAPCMSAWASLPVAMRPSGTITAPVSPARAA